MKDKIKNFLKSTILEVVDSISERPPLKWNGKGNRAFYNFDLKILEKDPEMVSYVTEYHANSVHSGHKIALKTEDRLEVDRIKKSLLLLQSSASEFGFKASGLWPDFDKKGLSNAIEMEPENFNIIGKLCYKLNNVIERPIHICFKELFLTLTILKYLENLSEKDIPWDQVYSTLGKPFFHHNGKVISPNIRYLEEIILLKKLVFNNLSDKSEIRVLEIGAGESQLSNLVLSVPNVKSIIIDLPSMHCRGPFWLYKYGKKVALYSDYIEAGKDVDAIFKNYDAIYLPPWAVEDLKCKFDLGINVRSLSEMSLDDVMRYLKFIDENCDAFFSLNTNCNNLDSTTHSNHTEVNTLEFINYLSKEVVDHGALFRDSIGMSTLHYVWGLYR